MSEYIDAHNVTHARYHTAFTHSEALAHTNIRITASKPASRNDDDVVDDDVVMRHVNVCVCLRSWGERMRGRAHTTTTSLKHRKREREHARRARAVFVSRREFRSDPFRSYTSNRMCAYGEYTSCLGTWRSMSVRVCECLCVHVYMFLADFLFVLVCESSS